MTIGSSNQDTKIWAIAPRFRLRPRFESQPHLLCFFQFILLKLKLYLLLECLLKDENKQKEADILKIDNLRKIAPLKLSL